MSNRAVWTCGPPPWARKRGWDPAEPTPSFQGDPTESPILIAPDYLIRDTSTDLRYPDFVAARKSNRGGYRPGSGRKPILSDPKAIKVSLDGETYDRLADAAEEREASTTRVDRRPSRSRSRSISSSGIGTSSTTRRLSLGIARRARGSSATIWSRSSARSTSAISASRTSWSTRTRRRIPRDMPVRPGPSPTLSSSAHRRSGSRSPSDRGRQPYPRFRGASPRLRSRTPSLFFGARSTTRFARR